MNVLGLPRMRTAVLSVVAITMMGGTAYAETMSMWVRASGANAAQVLVDLWNSKHDDKIEVTVIPDNQMVTKLATGVQAGDVPDVLSFDLIFMPDFMKAGLPDRPHRRPRGRPELGRGGAGLQGHRDLRRQASMAPGFTPDVSILVWNKDLFRQAGLDPEKPPTSIQQIQEYATKIHALGDDIYGFYFSGSCPGCNIFTHLADDGGRRRQDPADRPRR